MSNRNRRNDVLNYHEHWYTKKKESLRVVSLTGI